MASIAENVNIPSSSSDATSTKDAECVRVALRIRPLIGKKKLNAVMNVLEYQINQDHKY